MTTETLHHHDHEAETQSKTLFGFWLYVMSDCILFATLFIVYGVLHHNTFGGVGIKQIASMPYVLLQTLVLLFSAFTYGMTLLGVKHEKRSMAVFWLVITFILGSFFLVLEWHELAHLIATGNSWQRSAFLSSFFTLIATHGVHVLVGLIWMAVLFFQVFFQGVNTKMKTRFLCLGVFWHFLDIVWVFIFMVVYFMGAV